ncbi:MAG TPA: PfkB family carbohydrate kinase [Acidimicrobiales bacterium]
MVETSARFEWNLEDTVDLDEFERVRDTLDQDNVQYFLGGSAWNAIYSLAKMGVGLTLGYIGVAGRTEVPGLSFVREMERIGVDTTFVLHRPEERSGVCLSYIEDDERVLLTNAGANEEIANHIERNFDRLVNHLARTRAVHVTSFLDDPSSARVAQLVCEVKAARSEVLVSVDPGHVWASRRSSPVDELLGVADYVFCNRRELKLLGDYQRGDADIDLASRVIARNPGMTVVVAKRYDLVEVFRLGDSPLLMRTPSPASRQLDQDLEDATGAGDSFAAGMLAALLSSGLTADLGALVGLALSRYKRHGAPPSAPLAPRLDGGFLLFPGLTNVETAPPARVLLVRGASTEWDEVRRFLAVDCRLPVTVADDEAVEGGAPGRRPTPTRYVEQFGFAVCLLVADEGRPDLRAANQRVLQIAGAFHGRYGFDRVALVVEHGCNVLSNVAGVIRLEHLRGSVDQVLWPLEEMLQRERLV